MLSLCTKMLAARKYFGALAADPCTGGCMRLDERALSVLEVLEGSLGKREGSLLALLDRTASAPGRRRLRHWLCR
jgi:hypothetical protein